MAEKNPPNSVYNAINNKLPFRIQCVCRVLYKFAMFKVCYSKPTLKTHNPFIIVTQNCYTPKMRYWKAIICRNVIPKINQVMY